ncbi:hypothetical protein RFI_28493, partial [Reticulomyxa filosa]
HPNKKKKQYNISFTKKKLDKNMAGILEDAEFINAFESFMCGFSNTFHCRSKANGQRVLKGFELIIGQFVLKNFWLNSRNNPILEKIRLELAGHIKYITALPYKFLLYEAYGNLILSFECKNVERNPSQEEKIDIAPQMDWLAFYIDIYHEIKPVTKGRRVMIAFSLIVPKYCQDDFKYFKAAPKIETSSMSLNDK